MNTTYALFPHDALLSDGSLNLVWLHDLAQNPDDLHIEALAASGDYFALLASTLDQIGDALPPTSTESYQLQHAIHTLTYLHHHYDIKKKKP